MKSHWMLRLYPRAWRIRYEDEFRALLDDYPVSVTDLVDILMGAADAQVQYRQLSDSNVEKGRYSNVTPGLHYERARTQVRWTAALYVHAALFVIVNLLLLGINALTGSDTWWFVFPLWGTSMALIAHTATVVRGRALFATHAALFAVINAGLLWINLSNSDTYWFQWPLINLGILLVAHALIEFNVTGYFGAHLVVTVLAIAELAVVGTTVSDGFGAGGSDYWALWIIATLATLLIFHALLRFGNLSWLSAHIGLFIVLNTQFAIQDISGSGDRWFHYPLLAWAVVLAAHVGIRAGILPSFDSAWEDRKRQQLTQLAALEPHHGGDLEAHDAIQHRVSQLRYLNLHLFAFGVGAAMFLLLNVLAQSSGVWALWPLWGWSIILGAHAGYVLSRRSLLGAHLAVFALVNAGLFTIDIVYSDSRWFFWPLAGGVLLLLIHLALSQDTRRAIHDWEERRIASMLE